MTTNRVTGVIGRDEKRALCTTWAPATELKLGAHRQKAWALFHQPMPGASEDRLFSIGRINSSIKVWLLILLDRSVMTLIETQALQFRDSIPAGGAAPKFLLHST